MDTSGWSWRTSRWVQWWRAAPLAVRLVLGSLPLAHAETVARYGISMADIPLTTGQPDRGAGAYQFTGHTIYDPLIAWEANIAHPAGQAGAGSRDGVEGRSPRTTRSGASRSATA